MQNEMKAMAQTKIRSDYDPNTILTITTTDDGDVILHIHGDGEMRIATSGGQFHGNRLVAITDAFKKVIRLTKEDA